VNRWWASPETSTVVLKSVDDSDVINGVGVAILGYHGLAMGVLQPLVTQTLVDTYTVRKALSGIDLEPIAKALSEATKPVMGEASERYGKLLADAIHEKATDSTERLLHTWTNNGMPWPNAIERAAEVHGVPIERLGRYATVMKGATVNPHIRADYADRELMTYASVIGSREASISPELISKQSSEFEELHPRSVNGQFTDKAEVLDLRAKLNKFKKLKNAREVGSQIKRGTFEFAKPQTSNQKHVKVQPQVKTMATETTGTNFRTNFKKTPFKKPNFKIEPKPEHPTVATLFVEGDLYIPVNQDLLKDFQKQGNQFVAGDVVDLSPDRLQGELMALGKNGFSDYIETRGLRTVIDEKTVFLRCSSTPVYKNRAEVLTNSSGFPHADDFVESFVVPKAHFRLVTGKPEPRSLMSLINQGKYKQYAASDDDMFEDKFVVDSSDFLIYDIQLLNDDPELWEEDISKNLSEDELQHFNEEHPRSVNGQFADKNVSDLKAKLDKRNKMARQREIGQKAKQGNFEFKQSNRSKVESRQKAEVLRNEKAQAATNFKQSFRNNFKYVYRQETEYPLDFANLYGVIIPSGHRSKMYDQWPHFSNTDIYGVKNGSEAKEMPSGSVSDSRTIAKVFDQTYGSMMLLKKENRVAGDVALSPVIGNIITHADYREPEETIKAFRIEPNGMNSGEHSFNTSAEAKHAASTYMEKIEPSNANLVWQPEARFNEDGGFDAILAGYEPEEKYQIIIGSFSDMHDTNVFMNKLNKLKLDNEQFEHYLSKNVEIVPYTENDVENLRDLLAYGDSDELIDEFNGASRDKVTNPPIELYQIKFKGKRGESIV